MHLDLSVDFARCRCDIDLRGVLVEEVHGHLHSRFSAYGCHLSLQKRRKCPLKQAAWHVNVTLLYVFVSAIIRVQNFEIPLYLIELLKSSICT